MTHNVILFGAGASYGSDSIGTPPLGANLFDALVSFNQSGWGQVPPNMADIFRRDFEEGMRMLSNSNPHFMPPLQRAMAAYFFNFIPQKSSLYCELSRRINKSKWNGSISTINYERLLELSLISEGIRPTVGDTRTNSNEIELCLPHGCCHLFCESVRGLSSAVSFAGPMVETNGPVICIPNPSEFQSRIQNDAFPPVMSYFEPEKRTTSGANFIESQRRRFLELVSGASNIGVIGVKVRSNDNHIWDPLSSTSARLIYCSGKSGGQEFDSWTQQNREYKPNITLYGYFADCFDQICKELEIN